MATNPPVPPSDSLFRQLADFLARYDRLLTALVVALAVGVHVRDGLLLNRHIDLFIHRAGAAVGLAGQSPYHPGAVSDAVAEQYPERPDLPDNSGCFLPPEVFVLWAPFVALPWPAAKVLWAAVTFILATLAVRRLPVFAAAPPPGWVPPVLAAVVLLNPITVIGMLVAQTSVPAAACVVLGEAAFRAGRRQLAGFLWAVAFVKPHIALPLIPLAWYLGGWRRAAELVAWAGGLNLLGCLLSTGSPGLMLEYVRNVAAGHQSVAYNRAELNPQIASWNRFLFAAGGPLVEQNAFTTLAGYAVWGALVVGRVWLAGRRPTRAWAAAVTAIGAIVCSQAMGYEMAILVLVLPHILDLAAAGRRDAILIAVLLAFATAPLEVVHTVGRLIAPGADEDWLFVPAGPASLPDRIGAVLWSYRSFGSLLLGAAVLARGWPATPSPSSSAASG